MIRWILLFVLALTSLATSGLTATKSFYISTDGDDDSTGTSWSKAFRTPEKAFDVANESDWYYLGFDTLKISFGGGTSGTGVFVCDSTLKWENQDDVMLHLRAETGHTVSLISADPITGWTASATMIKAEWKNDWPPAEVPTESEAWLRVQDEPASYLVRFMLTHSGEAYNYIHDFDPSAGTIAAGVFGISAGYVYVDDSLPFTAYAPNVAPLLKVSNSVSVRLDTLLFRWSNPELDGGMVEIDAVDRVEIYGCSFRLSNWTGLKITNVPRDPNDACCSLTGVEIQNTAANKCAMSGMYLGDVYGLSLVSCDTDSNGWRGYYLDNVVYDNGGLILAGVEQGAIVDHQALRNDTRGVWVYGSKNVQIVNSMISYNKFDGVTLSANPAKIRFSGCTIQENKAPTGEEFSGAKAAGLRNSASDQVSIYDCDFIDNDVQYVLGADFAPCGFAARPFPSCGSSSLTQSYVSINGNNDSMIDVLLDAKDYGDVYGRDSLYVAEEDSTDYFDALYQLNVTIDD